MPSSLRAAVAGVVIAIIAIAGSTATRVDAASLPSGSVPHALTGGEGLFTAVTPFRTTGAGGPLVLGAGKATSVQIAGAGPVPTTATAVVVNVVIARATATTFLTVWPGGARPTASSLNANAGQVIANLVQIPLGPGGTVSVFNNLGTTSFYMDVDGYFGSTSGSAYTPMTPTRILDTRTTQSPLGPAATLPLPVAGVGGVPTDATAVVLNLTAVNPTSVSYLTAYPDGVTLPNASNLNTTPGATVPNLVTVGIGADGNVAIYNNRGSTNIVADVVGYYGAPGGSGLQFTGIPPGRLLDTRIGLGRKAGVVGAGVSIDVPIHYYGIPTEALAVVVNVTGTTSTAADDFVTAYPTGDVRPVASTLNLARGATKPNLAIVLGGETSEGEISLYNNAGTLNLVVDAVGYYSATYGDQAPNSIPPTYK
jgi:hypothetical protein